MALILEVNPLRAVWPEPLADGNCVTARWGGEEALRQISELTNRNRIQGRCGGVTRFLTGKPNSHTDTTQVNPAALEGILGDLPTPPMRRSRGPVTVPDRCREVSRGHSSPVNRAKG